MNINNIDEMIEHLHTLVSEPGTDRAVSSGRAIGFFLNELREEEIKKDDRELFSDKKTASLINLSK